MVVKIDLLRSPEFQAYLRNLPVQNFHAVLVVSEANPTGEVVVIQEGQSPPVVLSPQEIHNGASFK
jgi:hypothetical protein